MKNEEGNGKSKKVEKSEEFTRFEQTLRHLVAVPKSEVDKERVKYERRRAKERKGKAND
jgi:hypothetical protein